MVADIVQIADVSPRHIRKRSRNVRDAQAHRLGDANANGPVVVDLIDDEQSSLDVDEYASIVRSDALITGPEQIEISSSASGSGDESLVGHQQVAPRELCRRCAHRSHDAVESTSIAAARSGQNTAVVDLTRTPDRSRGPSVASSPGHDDVVITSSSVAHPRAQRIEEGDPEVVYVSERNCLSLEPEDGDEVASDLDNDDTSDELNDDLPRRQLPDRGRTYDVRDVRFRGRPTAASRSPSAAEARRAHRQAALRRTVIGAPGAESNGLLRPRRTRGMSMSRLFDDHFPALPWMSGAQSRMYPAVSTSQGYHFGDTSHEYFNSEPPWTFPYTFEALAALDDRAQDDRRRASSQVIRALPVVRATEADTAESCRVCLSDFELNEVLRRLPCSHVYHKGCIDKWLSRNGCCPVDKRRVDECPIFAS